MLYQHPRLVQLLVPPAQDARLPLDRTAWYNALRSVHSLASSPTAPPCLNDTNLGDRVIRTLLAPVPPGTRSLVETTLYTVASNPDTTVVDVLTTSTMCKDGYVKMMSRQLFDTVTPK